MTRTRLERVSPSEVNGRAPIIDAWTLGPERAAIRRMAMRDVLMVVMIVCSDAVVMFISAKTLSTQNTSALEEGKWSIDQNNAWRQQRGSGGSEDTEI